MRDYDVAIIGGGPAGLTSAIYLARANKRVIVFEKEAMGGKITESPRVENIPGFTVVSGSAFGEHLSCQAETNGVELQYDEIISVVKNDNSRFILETDFEKFEVSACIVAVGTTNRVLGLENESKLIGNGISFCVTCDGPYYKNKSVAVIGGGNSAVTEAIALSEMCKNVTIIQNLPKLTAEQVLIDELCQCLNINVLTNSTVTKYNYIGSEKRVKLCSVVINNDTVLDIDGVFLAIGVVPNNALFSSLVQLDPRGYIITDRQAKTSTAGVFAAGDCVSESIQQVSVACGSGTVAALSCKSYLDSLDKQLSH